MSLAQRTVWNRLHSRKCRVWKCYGNNSGSTVSSAGKGLMLLVTVAMIIYLFYNHLCVYLNVNPNAGSLYRQHWGSETRADSSLPPGGMIEGCDGCGWDLQIVSGDEEFQTNSGRPMYQSETHTNILNQMNSWTTLSFLGQWSTYTDLLGKHLKNTCL